MRAAASLLFFIACWRMFGGRRNALKLAARRLDLNISGFVRVMPSTTDLTIRECWFPFGFPSQPATEGSPFSPHRATTTYPACFFFAAPYSTASARLTCFHYRLLHSAEKKRRKTKKSGGGAPCCCLLPAAAACGRRPAATRPTGDAIQDADVQYRRAAGGRDRARGQRVHWRRVRGLSGLERVRAGGFFASCTRPEALWRLTIWHMGGGQSGGGRAAR